MVEKRIYGRAVQKHDLEKNWIKASNFIPMAGEIIVYDRDDNVADESLKGIYSYERIKIGDGVQNVNTLPFVGDEIEIGGRNLLADTNFVLEMTKNSEKSVVININSVPNYNLNSLIGKTITFSYFCHSPGERESFITGNMANRFGMHVTIKWISSETGQSSNDYTMHSFLSSTIENKRVSASRFLVAPDGYDSIGSITVALQAYSKPASGNDATWLLGYPKLEVGNKATDWSPAPEDLINANGNSIIDLSVSGQIITYTKNDGTTNSINLSVDDALSSTSTNPVQNQVINAAISDLNTLVGDEPVSDQIDKALLNSQANWNQSDDTASDFIKNKPTLVGIAGTGANSEIFNHYTANKANGTYSHAEGYGTTADGNYTHAEGSNTTAKKEAAHAEGQDTVANGTNSHAEGYRTTTLGNSAHAEGLGNTKCPTDITYGTDDDAVIETWKTSSKFTLAKGKGSHAEGYSTLALGDYSHAEGSENIAKGESSHAEGYMATASGDRSHAEGYMTTASGNDSHAEGNTTTAGGQYSHAEGYKSIANAAGAHAEGNATASKGQASHAEGCQTTSIGYAAHTEGYSTYKVPDTITTSTNNTTIIEEHQTTPFTLAKGQGSHAEGYDTLSLGAYASHAEGYRTRASGDYSHAEGGNTVASGMRSHAEGYNTIASSANQHVQGKYNIEDSNSQYAHIVGNGSGTERSNAHTIDWQGNAWFAGDIRVGGTSYADAISLLPKSTSVTLSSSAWTGSSNPWSQVITVNGATSNSKIDLQPTAVQIVELQDDEITLMLQNDDGIVTAWAIGNKPTQDYEMQVLITEVVRV